MQRGYWIVAAAVLVGAVSAYAHPSPESSNGTVTDEHGVTYVEGTDIVLPVGPWARETDARVTPATDCRANIANVLCLAEGTGGGWGRSCLPETKKYVPVFEHLYDRFPPVLKKMFCHMERIYLEKDIDSTAYALRAGGVIGIRSSLVEENLSLWQWSTWKEQLSFGGSLTSYLTRNDLPIYEGSGGGTENNFLYSVVAHEFGHLLDFANHLNGGGFFGSVEGTWAGLSWKNFSTPKAGNDYSLRPKMCFYDCGSDYIPKSDIPGLYEELYGKTNFLNTYTARNPYEDFADNFSFYLLFKNTDVGYVLNTQQGASYDLRVVQASERLAPKVSYIRQFLGRGDAIRYPSSK